MSEHEDYRRAEIVVDLGAIRRNVEKLCDAVAAGSDGPAVMVVVKADGYGHGLFGSARAARAGGATWLGVADRDEALDLREEGDTGRMLAWLGMPGEDYGPLIEADVDVAAYSTQQLEEIVEGATATGKVARVHLKVDTGLSRGGAPLSTWKGLVDAAAKAEKAGHVKVAGIWSHFACSDEPEHASNDLQEEAFEAALEVADKAGLEPEVRHLANSAAALLRPSSWYDLVRFGIAAYGLSPAPHVTNIDHLELEPAMTVHAKAALTKDLAIGDAVSYGHTFTAERPMRVALVPLGYGDGIPRHASSLGPVQIRGHRGRILGRVCMDQFVAEAPRGTVAGDEVVLFGPGTNGEPTAQEWAEACGTISYEIVTRMGGSANRVAKRWTDDDGSLV
ncbi:alanine racemase [Nocardioides marmorisolisilvae]|uniref:Alanine racemase n=1 Tax=Nocardioides marmorisolisilvae TaxID=1542737 RepID=A0A3N0DZN7_9ACTN|nr:alanine racemase [Nocardioides marmorisolisilvae]RNL80966.1 alanine racemase [Nocardioides marmorisolisilvae]